MAGVALIHVIITGGITLSIAPPPPPAIPDVNLGTPWLVMVVGFGLV